ncbi:hypothetical protein GGR50DRAFT_688860 [Xylaria sp. CBS 124048]|nr:hypothetical protein GGR50DRAFT_688860 [Xylaria sp. CBS 124048]
MNHSWTITDGTYDPMPQNKRRKRDVPYPAFVNHTFRSMNALSGLQLSHNSPIPMTALDIANDHVWKCMPREVSLYLYMPAPNGPALWSPDEEAVKAMYEKMEDKDYFLAKDDNTTEMEYRGYINIKRRPWIIWPLYVEDQWGCDYVTVVWYSNSSDELCALFDQIVAYAIIDPRRSLEPDANGRYGPVPERMERIRTRLFEFLRRAGMNTENARALDLRCPPMEFGETSSGERCFAVVKALMNQIMDWCLNGMTFCPETTLKSMHQWVLPFQQRVELTGINAWVLMASLDYDARITVEAILPSTETAVVADGKMKMLINYDLAGPCTQPSLASWDYLLPADHKYVAPAQT